MMNSLHPVVLKPSIKDRGLPAKLISASMAESERRRCPHIEEGDQPWIYWSVVYHEQISTAISDPPT